MKYIKLFFVLLSVGILMSCEKENEDFGADFSISGYAQKGQFIKGATITAYALNDKLLATGESFPSVIKDDLGSFAISAEVTAPYLELKAEGYYFIENTGETSTSPIYLNALASSSQEKININLLTTLTSGRIKKLINEGKSFEVAKKQAERELINIFSFQPESVTLGFEEMNISEDGNSNAILLAVSCLIQEGRNAGEVQKIISDISSEFETKGNLSEKLLQDIFNEYRQVSISDVVRHLITYYNKNGIVDFKIPPFYAMLNKEYSSGFHVISMGENLSTDGYDTDVQGGIKEYYAISYNDFVVESDVDWITAETEELCTNLYMLKIKVSPSTEISGRTGHLHIKSKSGEILYTNTTNQRGNGQRIYIEIGANSPRTKAFNNGDKVNINGQDYELLFDSCFNKYYVDLPKTDNGYGISNVPEMVVAGKNGDVLCATFTYKSEIEEYIYDITEDTELTRISQANSYGASIETVGMGQIPCYAALKGMPGYDLPNPAQVSLKPSCSLITLRFRNENPTATVDIAKVELEFAPDGFLSGEITTCMYPDQAMYDPSYVIPKDEYNNKSNQVVVRNTNKDDKVAFLVHPQTIHTLKCVAYDSNGSQILQVMQDINLDINKGANLNFEFTVKK